MKTFAFSLWFLVVGCVGSNRAPIVADRDGGVEMSDAVADVGSPDSVDAVDSPLACVGDECVPPCESDEECDDGVACTGDLCDKGRCSHAPTHAACDDARACDGIERCDPLSPSRDARGCIVGIPIACDDGVDCTTDSCDDDSGECSSVVRDDACAEGQRCDRADDCVGDCATDGDCDDGMFCNGEERCDVAAGCVAGDPPTCDDGVECTADACDPLADACIAPPDHARCGDGDLCFADSGCRVVECFTDTDCDDGLYCDGVERCVRDRCMLGHAPDCADDVACTVDLCDEGADACAHVENDRACDDGNFCNGGEFCDVSDGCLVGEPPTCDDTNACTSDACDDGRGACTHVSIAAACDDGQFCNGAERCDVVLGCTMGLVPICDDGVSCTADSCDDDAGGCMHVPDDATCGDGIYCDGAEVCDKFAGCVAGPMPTCDDGVECTSDRCDVARDACVHDAPDRDVDGHRDLACGGDDCDDADAGAHPGAGERCNGRDDDCDGMVDEALGQSSCGVGACNRVVDNCAGGAPQMCMPGAPAPEFCNRADDDCNGAVDDHVCGNAACEAACGETACSCAADCGPTCGDGCCTGGETCGSCFTDCHLPGAICCPGRMRCNGANIEQCSADGAQWSPGGRCTNGCLMMGPNGACCARPDGGGCA